MENWEQFMLCDFLVFLHSGFRGTDKENITPFEVVDKTHLTDKEPVRRCSDLLGATKTHLC